MTTEIAQLSNNIEKAAVYLKDAIVDVSPQVFDMTVKAVKVSGYINLASCALGAAFASALIWVANKAHKSLKAASYNEEGFPLAILLGSSAVAAFIILCIIATLLCNSTWMKVFAPELFMTLKAYEAIGIKF